MQDRKRQIVCLKVRRSFVLILAYVNVGGWIVESEGGIQKPIRRGRKQHEHVLNLISLNIFPNNNKSKRICRKKDLYGFSFSVCYWFLVLSSPDLLPYPHNIQQHDEIRIFKSARGSKRNKEYDSEVDHITKCSASASLKSISWRNGNNRNEDDWRVNSKDLRSGSSFPFLSSNTQEKDMCKCY